MKLLLLHRWALRLLPLRKICLLVAVAGWAVLAVLLLDADDPHAFTIRLLLLLTLWALLLFSFISLFKTAAPVVLPALNWQERLLARLQFWLFYGMACTFVVLVLVALSLSLKLLLLN
jgi:hypothetical protein